jgi:predicted dehydrogenase
LGVAWGILSTADINRLVLEGARKSDRVDVVAVASRDRAQAEDYARRHGIERAYGRYEDLLEDPAIEVVYNPLPNSLHVEWSIEALEAGKHVLCEKPFSRHAGEVERAFDAAERAGRLLTEGFMYRHHPQTRLVQQLVDEGAIGRLHTVRSSHAFDLMARSGGEDIRLDADLEGGALMDVGCYCVNGMRLLAGEPDRVYGEQTLGPTGVDTDFHGTMRFPDDVVGQFFVSFSLPSRQELEAIGTEGSVRLTRPFRLDIGGDATLRRGDDVVPIDFEEADSYQLELEHLSDAIRAGTEPLLGREDALGNAHTIEALYRSAELGAPTSVGSKANS